MYSGLAEEAKPKRDASACPKMAQTKLKEQKVIRSKLKRKKALRTKTTKSPRSGSDGDDLNLEYDPRGEEDSADSDNEITVTHI